MASPDVHDWEGAGSSKELMKKFRPVKVFSPKTITRLRLNMRRIKKRKQNIRDGTFSCQNEVCLYRGGTMQELALHKKTHTRDMEFRCALCPYKTNSKNNLKRHSLTHTGVKAFACDVCTFTTALSSHLKEHKRRHDGIKGHQCDECDSSFVTSSALKQHKFKHSGIKPFVCDVCDFATDRAARLNDHLFTIAHSGPKSHGCEFEHCIFRSATPFGIYLHMKRKHK